MNPITKLRLKRAKSRRAPMPVSQKPRRFRSERELAPDAATRAGILFYSWFEAAARRQLAGPTMEETERRARTSKRRVIRRGNCTYHAAAPAGSREAERRKRQKLVQHPSVIERFKNHPTRSQIDAQIAAVEGRAA